MAGDARESGRRNTPLLLLERPASTPETLFDDAVRIAQADKGTAYKDSEHRSILRIESYEAAGKLGRLTVVRIIEKYDPPLVVEAPSAGGQHSVIATIAESIGVLLRYQLDDGSIAHGTLLHSQALPDERNNPRQVEFLPEGDGNADAKVCRMFERYCELRDAQQSDIDAAAQALGALGIFGGSTANNNREQNAG